MCNIRDVNIYPFSFRGQQKGLKALDISKVVLTEGTVKENAESCQINMVGDIVFQVAA